MEIELAVPKYLIDVIFFAICVLQTNPFVLLVGLVLIQMVVLIIKIIEPIAALLARQECVTRINLYLVR